MRPALRAVVLLAAAVLAVGATAWAASRPRDRHATALPLAGAGVEGRTLVHDKDGRLVVFNVRTVERGVLYRGSAFPVNVKWNRSGELKDYPAALLGAEAFELMRSLNVRHVVTMNPDDDAFYAEEGYFKYWSERTGHPVKVSWVPVGPDDAYGRNDRSALRAAGRLLSLMAERKPTDGAFFVHGECGKDSVGVVAAAYEIWRNRGRVQRDTLWNQVLARYLASNRTLSEAGDPAAGKPVRCASQVNGYVCAEWLVSLRSDLEYLAELT